MDLIFRWRSWIGIWFEEGRRTIVLHRWAHLRGAMMAIATTQLDESPLFYLEQSQEEERGLSIGSHQNSS